MPEHKHSRTTDRRTGGGAARWVGVIVIIVLVLALLGWIFGWYTGEEEVLLETDQPEALAGEEAVVAPESDAEASLNENGEEALEPEFVDDADVGQEEGALEGEAVAPAE